MSSTPQWLYTADQSRELDRLAIEEFGLAGSTLMERAGAAGFNALRRHWPRARRIAVVCGGGNNGGDGYVVARLAAQAGLEPTVLTMAKPKTADAIAVAHACAETGVAVDGFSDGALTGADVVVDAMFGTGLERELAGPWRDAVEAINATAVPVLALDLPSGLHADTGRVLGVAVRAEITATFIGLKRGMVTGCGREYCGRIEFDDLAVPAAAYARVAAGARLLDEHQQKAARPRRPRHAHKGDAGRVLILGGDHGMAGAARMAAEAAGRGGAGLVTVATRGGHVAAIVAGRPELIVHGVEDGPSVRRLAAGADAIAAGPGLGRGDWGRRLWGALLEVPAPLVVDADALYWLARDPLRREDWILTPHPGEAGRLLGCDARAVQADRYTTAAQIAERYGGVCVLKGAGTVIAGGDAVAGVCGRGNPGMASAGMGDVLTGLIAALLGQGLAPRAAAELGVWLHAGAGDLASRYGEIGLLATDLMPWLRQQLNAGR